VQVIYSPEKEEFLQAPSLFNKRVHLARTNEVHGEEVGQANDYLGRRADPAGFRTYPLRADVSRHGEHAHAPARDFYDRFAAGEGYAVQTRARKREAQHLLPGALHYRLSRRGSAGGASSKPNEGRYGYEHEYQYLVGARNPKHNPLPFFAKGPERAAAVCPPLLGAEGNP
jgi:hypothetical protein